MLYQLIKRDPAWRFTPAFTLAAAIIVPAIARSGFSFMLTVLYASSLSGMAMLVRPFERCTLLEATLPLRTRAIYLARVLSLLAFCLLPAFAAALGIVAATGTGGSVMAFQFVELGVLLSLLALILFAVQPRRFNAPVWLNIVLWLSFLPLLGLRSFWYARPGTVVLVGCCLLAGIVIFIATWLALPSSFQIQDQQVSESQSQRRLIPFFSSPVIHSMTGRLALLALVIPVMASTTNGWPLAAMFFFSAEVHIFAALRWMVFLPVARRKLLLLAIVPPVAGVVCGFLIGAIAVPEPGNGHQLAIFECGSYQQFCLDAHPAAWEWSIADPHLVITAPWGESYPAKTRRFFGITLTNPWTVPSNASRRFFDWQLDRAIRAIYGHPVRRQDLLLGRGHAVRPVFRQTRMVIACAGFIVAAALLLAFILHLRAWSRLPGRPFSAYFFIGLTAVAGFGMLFLPISAVDHKTDILPYAVLYALSEHLPQNTAAVVAIVLGIIAALYWLLEKQFREIELFTLMPAKTPGSNFSSQPQ